MGGFKSEFQRQNFGLHHEPVDDFFRSQWQRKRVSVLWLIYRWALALCFAGGVIGSMVVNFNRGTWFIYLTDWGFTLCMLTSVVGAILATIYAFDGDKFAAGSKVVKFYWALYSITITTALLITFIYWLFIFPVDEANADDLFNLWAHGFNTILMVLDHMLVAFPTRILHLIYPFTIGIVYGLFSLIYYLTGGEDYWGNRYIYEILDWSQPGWAVVTVLGSCVLLIIFGMILFGLYKLRMAIYHKKSNSIIVLNT